MLGLVVVLEAQARGLAPHAIDLAGDFRVETDVMRIRERVERDARTGELLGNVTGRPAEFVIGHANDLVAGDAAGAHELQRLFEKAIGALALVAHVWLAECEGAGCDGFNLVGHADLVLCNQSQLTDCTIAKERRKASGHLLIKSETVNGAGCLQ